MGVRGHADTEATSLDALAGEPPLEVVHGVEAARHDAEVGLVDHRDR